MKKGRILTFSLLVISLLSFLVVNASIVNFSKNTNEKKYETEQINYGDEAKNIIFFDHKDQIAALKEYKGIKVRNRFDINNKEEFLQSIPKEPMVLMNHYTSLYQTDTQIAEGKDKYTINSYMLVYSYQNVDLDTLLNITNKISLTYYFTSINNQNPYPVNWFIESNYDESVFSLNINTTEKLNFLIKNHFFLIKFNFSFSKNLINYYYYFNDDLLLTINTDIGDYHFSNLNSNFTINSFNLNYIDNFYISEPSIKISNFILFGDGKATFDIDILLQKNIKIDEFINNLTIETDYRSYDNSVKNNDFKLTLNKNYNEERLGYTSWYKTSMGVSNLSKKGEYVYYNFSFFSDGKEIFTNKWLKDFKVATPEKPPEIEEVYYERISLDSYYLFVEYDSVENYEQVNNIKLQSTNNEDMNLIEPFYVGNNTYRYTLNNLENDYYSYFTFANSGYYTYDLIHNDFYKDYYTNPNFVYYNQDYNELIIHIKTLNYQTSPVILNSKISEKQNHYYLKVSYSSSAWTNQQLRNIEDLRLDYFVGSNINDLNVENQMLHSLSDYQIDNGNIQIRYYEITNVKLGYIYKDVNFSLDESLFSSNGANFLPKEYYVSNFSNKSSISNVDLIDKKRTELTFDVSFNDTSELQVKNIVLTYEDSKGNIYDSISENNLIVNSIVSSNNNQITYQYTLVDLDKNETYTNFNFYIPNDVDTTIRNHYLISYDLTPNFSSNIKIKTSSTFMLIVKIVLLVMAVLLYISLFIFLVIKLISYNRKKI